MSEQTPVPGGFGVGSQVAGYRLDEQIGRGGMAVVYRAYDDRLERRVALKILAPELARDEEFRQRFIRESRAAAAVDHHNIIPIYEAGEAGGVLFIAMRFVDGRDVQSLVNQQGVLPPSRVCDIVSQVASALDAAHAHGLVHRDVKPANMLREPASGGDHADHVYLSDFGLSKHSLSQSGLTSQGQFLGTLNYVAPEQIEGRPVDGRTDEYALACSAFEMMSGTPPFRRDETLAIMYAQLSSAPPSITSIRPDLPAAVDQVMAQALAKAPDERYSSCLEFAAALRRACGIGPGGTDPGLNAPGRAATRAVLSSDLAAASGAGTAGMGSGGGAGGMGPAGGAGGMGTRGVSPGGMGTAAVPGARQPQNLPPAVDLGHGEPETQGIGVQRSGPTRAQPAGPTKPGLTDPMGDFAHLYAPAKAPPRRSRRTLAAVVAGCVVLLGVGGGAYLLLGKGGGGGGGGKGGGTTTLTRTFPPATCTTATAHAAPQRQVHTAFAQVGGKPFDVVVSPNGFGFVSLRKGSPLLVMNTKQFVPTTVNTVFVPNDEGEVFTHDQKYLLVAGDSGLTVFRTQDLESGQTTPVGSLASPGGKGAIEVVTSPDDSFAFVTLQNSGQVAVFNLKKALTSGFSGSDFVGFIQMSSDPVGIATSPSGQYLYVVSGLAGTALQSGMGTLAVIDTHKAEVNPAKSVTKTINAGCGPARVLASPDGKYVWVTAGGGNALEGFAAGKLISDPKHALIAKVAVGQIPLGLVLVNHGTRIVVADSNRDNVAGSHPDLAVINVADALAGKPALLGVIKSGLAPRQFAVEPNGRTLLVTNTDSGQLESVNLGHLP